MFDLRRPCVNCPFRKNQGHLFGLDPERLEEIKNAPAFQCHNTVVYGEGKPEQGDRPQQCAGLMAVLHREDIPNQIMQVAERISSFDPSLLDPEGEAFASWADALAAHARWA